MAGLSDYYCCRCFDTNVAIAIHVVVVDAVAAAIVVAEHVAGIRIVVANYKHDPLSWASANLK